MREFNIEFDAQKLKTKQLSAFNTSLYFIRKISTGLFQARTLRSELYYISWKLYILVKERIEYSEKFSLKVLLLKFVPLSTKKIWIFCNFSLKFLINRVHNIKCFQFYSYIIIYGIYTEAVTKYMRLGIKCATTDFFRSRF